MQRKPWLRPWQLLATDNGDTMNNELRQQIERDAIRDFAARVDARAGELIQAGRARNAHYHALKAELAAVEAQAVEVLQ